MSRSNFVMPFAATPIVALLTASLAACSGGSTSLPGASSASAATPVFSAATPVLGAALPSATPISSPRVVAKTVGTGQMPFSADSLPGDHDAGLNFIDSIGVCTKLQNAAQGTPYGNQSALKAALLGLGIRHIRDGFTTQNLNNYENNLIDLANSGIHSELVVTQHEDANNNAILNDSPSSVIAYLQAGHFSQSIEALEGLNEPDVNQAAPNGPAPTGWAALARSTQQALYTGVQGLTPPAKRVPVYGPSVAQSRITQIGDLSQYMDFGNIHNYSGGYDLTPASITSTLASEATLSGSKPVMASENGYSIGTTGQAMPNDIMLDYAQRLFFKQFAYGVKRTMWYEFMDETNVANDYWNNEGLVTTTMAPKPAYVGLKNIINLLKDPTPYTQRTPLNFSFGNQGQFENLTDLLLQKNDGSYYLAVWSDVGEWNPAANGLPGSYPVPAPASFSNALNILGTYVASITEYDEDSTGAMTSKPVAVTNGATAQITVGVRPIILKIVPGTAPVVPTAKSVSGTAAHWSFDEGSGLVAADSVNPVGNMTIPNSPTKVSWVAGPYNAALGFTGTQASTTSTVIDTSQSYSATAWIQLNTLAGLSGNYGYQSAVAVNGLNQSAFTLGYNTTSKLSYSVYSSDASGTMTRIGSSVTPVVGQWYALAATYNSTTGKMSFYVNGALQGTATTTKVFKAAGGTEIGSMMQAGVGHYQWFAGNVDEVNMYQRELTPAEVATLAGN